MTSHISTELKEAIRAQGVPSPIPNDSLVELFSTTARDGRRMGAGPQVWLLLITGALFTLNVPSAMTTFVDWAFDQDDLIEAGVTSMRNTSYSSSDPRLYTAGLMLEAGLKTISFNGVPKAIEGLKALSQAIRRHEKVWDALPTEPRRRVTADNLPDVDHRGRELWDSIYDPLSDRLLGILGQSHPDLPVHILHSHYAQLLSPVSPELEHPWDLDRQLSSVIAVTCLRTQGGVAPQVESHVRGLLKAKRGLGGDFVAKEDGAIWLLKAIDEFAAGIRKLI